MAKRRCIACGTYFQIRSQVPRQTYCSNFSCQRERRQEWQRHKLQTDPDHRDNKSRAQQTWAGRNPDYWRQYREAHPEYVERNRSKQRERNATREREAIAKKAGPVGYGFGIFTAMTALILRERRWPKLSCAVHKQPSAAER